MAAGHLHLGQPHQVTRMVDAFGRAKARDLVILTQKWAQYRVEAAWVKDFGTEAGVWFMPLTSHYADRQVLMRCHSTWLSCP
jgi:hypothetical protein